MKDLRFNIDISDDGSLELPKTAKNSLKNFKGMKFEMILHPVAYSNKKNLEKIKNIKRLIKKCGNDEIFKEVSDPISWQKDIRSEWG